MPESLRLIVGLGNPDPEHTATRHNAGFWFLDRLAAGSGVTFSMENRFLGQLSRIQNKDIDCRLLKPQTYMNESGRSVAAVMSYFKIDVGEILVIHDEIDLEPGTIRLKQGGGHAGHNGVRNIIDHIGSSDFLRLRIGVGHPGHKDGVIGAVLGSPSKEDKQMIEEAINRGIDIMPMIFEGEYEKVMTRLHSSNKQQATSDEDKDEE